MAETIPYARPADRTHVQAWAGFALVLSGLGLIALGGCFLIGVMMLANPRLATFPVGQTVAEQVLLVTLYVMALACFVGAAALMVLGVRSLLRLARRGSE